MEVREVELKIPAVSYFHTGRPRTIIGDAPLHFRVRNGIGWFRRSNAAGKTDYKLFARRPWRRCFDSPINSPAILGGAFAGMNSHWLFI